MALQQGLWTLANTMAQPAQLSGAQQALSSPLTQSINPEDPYSLRDAAKHAMNKGDVMTGQKYMQQAANVEQRKAEERIEGIRNTYAKMKASGNAEAFEKGMIDSGQADIIAQIKQEDLERDVAMATGNETLDKRQANKDMQLYFSAQTEAGKAAVLEKLQREGKGNTINLIKAQERQIQKEELLLSAKQVAQQEQALQAEIDALPVPQTEDEIMKVAGSLDPKKRGRYVQKVKERLEDRKAIRDFVNDKPDQELDANILALANMDEDTYKSLVSGIGIEKANAKVVDRAFRTNAPKDDDSFKLTSAIEDAIRTNIAAEVEEGKGLLNSELDFDNLKSAYEGGPSVEQRVTRAFGVYQKTGKIEDAINAGLTLGKEEAKAKGEPNADGIPAGWYRDDEGTLRKR
jgi:hypothetical protein